MKKNALFFCCMFVVVSLTAQNRRYLSSFQFYPSYYNPAMTGFSGTNISATYRNSRWVGFEGAPQTYLMSADVIVKRHAFGGTVLHDSFGPYRESEALVNYGHHINLSRTIQLRIGAAATLNMQRLDMSALELNSQNDPAFQNFKQDFNKNMAVDFNIGMAVTTANFYVGYALQNTAQGALIGNGDFFNRLGYLRHVTLAGYRTTLSNKMGVIVSGLYRYDPTFRHALEMQVKAVVQNMAWIGLGYRSDMTPIALLGLRARQLQLGISYELSSKGNSQANSGTSEIVLNYKIKKKKSKVNKRDKKPKSNSLTIW